MNLNFKEIFSYLLIAIIFNIISHLLGTKYLFAYLSTNIITIQITIMAISTAIRGLVVSKLQEVKNKFPETSLKPITKALLFSFKEQIFLLATSILLNTIADSKISNKLIFSEYFDFVIEVSLFFVFVYAVDILWDTGKSIFVIIDSLEDLS
jgi:hypothetical protein